MHRSLRNAPKNGTPTVMEGITSKYARPADCTATTGYQTRTFSEAGRALGLDLVLATDRCHVLEDPWGDHAVAVRF